MTTPTGLPVRLARAAPAELAAFAAACATRMTPVFGYFTRTGPDRFREWAAELWAAARLPEGAGVAPVLGRWTRDRAREVLRQIGSLPETADGADSNRPDYYAIRAVGVLFYAARVLLDGDKAATAIACSREARTLLYGFDYLLHLPPGAASSLETLESRTQHEWLDRHAGSLTGDLAAEARASAVAERLAESAPAIAQVRGWDMAQWRLA
jgi:hypothetical protein